MSRPDGGLVETQSIRLAEHSTQSSPFDPFHNKFVALLRSNMSLPPLQLSSSKLSSGQLVWTVKWAGETVATALSEELALDYSREVLGCKIQKEEDHWRLAGQPMGQPLGPIDFERAKLLATAKMLWLAENDLQTPVEIVDRRCVEYEWGWEMHWQPKLPHSKQVRNLQKYRFPFLVDRMTGVVGSAGGTRGLCYGIVLLLQRRPQELCGPYPFAPDEWWASVAPQYKRLGAFQPLQPE